MKGCKLNIVNLIYFLRTHAIKFFLMLMSLMVLTAQGQVVGVNASTDKNRILLGEPLWLTLEIKTLNNAPFDPFKVDSIPHFEFLIKDSTRTIQKGDTSIFKQYYQLTSFDSGQWVIPSFTFRPFVKTNSILIDVVFTEDFDPTQPYHDVQDVLDVSFRMDPSQERWWYPIVIFLIVLVLLIYWITGERPQQAKPVKKSTESAYAKALRNLKELKTSHIHEKGYYEQLIEIFRAYVLERTGISSLQHTSTDLAQKLQPLFRDEIRYDSLVQVMYMCDFVKFAKYMPQKSEALSAYEVIEGAVHYLEDVLNKNPQLIKSV